MESTIYPTARPAARRSRSRLWQCAAAVVVLGGLVTGAANADWLGQTLINAPRISLATADPAPDAAGGDDSHPRRDPAIVEAGAQGAGVGKSGAIRRSMHRASDDGAIPAADQDSPATGSSASTGSIIDADFAIASPAHGFGSGAQPTDQTSSNADGGGFGGFGGASGMGSLPGGGGGGVPGGLGSSGAADPASATDDGGNLVQPLLGALSESGGVPEPATWAMMALGLGLAGAALRRARRPEISR